MSEGEASVSESVDRFQEMENERNSRMMVLMTALKDYIGCVTAEINELRSLAQIGVPATKLPGKPAKITKKTKKKTVKKKPKKALKEEEKAESEEE